MSWTTGLVLGIVAVAALFLYSFVRSKTEASGAEATAEREAREKLQEAAKAADARKKAEDAKAAKWARGDGRTAGEWLRDAGRPKA